METEELILNSKQILIMETAEQLFATNGYDATSIRDIAASGSFNSAMISYYFGSKEQLMEGILRYRTTVLEDVVNDLLLTLKDPLEKILAITDFYIEKVFQQKYFYLLLIQVQSMPEKHTLIRNSYNTIRYRNFALLDAMIKEGQEKGQFKKDIDIALLLFIISGTVNNILINQDYYKDVNQMNHLSDLEVIVHLKEKVGILLKETIEGIVLRG